ncbi:Ubiquitin-like-specific protease 1D [Platanthera guangdongensis]|uniref:Ubiquitin-like-specific protease 1D n=1 Tax=Platanthera guangdongensis TaxID=2320717 RepID=A0ABR2N221_9ASPA
MATKPLKIDWGQVLSEKEEAAPPLELVVVPTPPPVIASSPVSEASSSQMIRYFTDRQIEEKLLRMIHDLDSGLCKKLPDKGLKYQARIRLYQEELDRRKLARIQKSAENCETATESKIAESIGSPDESLATSECESQSSFAFMFNKKLDRRAGSMSTSKISSSNPSQMHKEMNLCNLSSHSARVSSRKAPSTQTSRLPVVRRKKSANINYNNINTSNFYSRCTGRRFSKRLRDSDERDTLRPKKVHVLVLLDEEDAQTKDLTKCASEDGKEVKMYYPSRDDPQSVELSYSDMKCLEPEQYISSPIMNFYIRYLQRSHSAVNRAKREYYFFNTYFYGKLKEALISSKCDRSLQFSKLRRWWKGVNIFEKAYIFLPIHEDLHWSLVIISVPPKEDESCIITLHLDSLGMHNSSQIFEVIQCCLTEEWKHLKQNATSTRIPSPINKIVIKVPQQKNEYDCGLFVLYFMERFIEEAPQRLDWKNVNMFGREWFQPEDASGLRKRLKDLLSEEFESSRVECGRVEELQESPSSSSSSEREEEPTIQS